MLFKISSILLFIWSICLIGSSVNAIPPACFLSCINEISKVCTNSHNNLSCICSRSDSLVGCIVDICPYGNFEAARDHFFGTCLEHSKPITSTPVTPSSSSGETVLYPDDTLPDHPIELLSNDKSEVGKLLQYSNNKASDYWDKQETDANKWQEDSTKEDYHFEAANIGSEEMKTTDISGNTIIDRIPINVPIKFKEPSNQEDDTKYTKWKSRLYNKNKDKFNFGTNTRLKVLRRPKSPAPGAEAEQKVIYDGPYTEYGSSQVPKSSGKVKNKYPISRNMVKFV